MVSPGTQPLASLCDHFQKKATLFGGCLALAVVLMATRGAADAIVSCGFEATGDTWAYTFNGGVLNTDPGSADSPANQRILSGSSQSWLVSDTTSTLYFSELWLSGWKNVVVKYHVSSTAKNGGGGNIVDDCVKAYVATSDYANSSTPDLNKPPDVTIAGSGSGATWGYDNGAKAIKVRDGRRSLKFQIFATNDGQNKCWNLDNIVVEGTATSSNEYLWDGDATGSVGGGSGVWDNTSATPWASDSTGANHTAWNSANGDNVRFTQSGGTVTIRRSTIVAARSLTFTADGYTIDAGGDASRLVLTNGGSGGPGPNTIDVVNCAHTATICATIVGNQSAGLTKTGNGTLVLSGDNAYTGTTTINAGVVGIFASGNLGAPGARVSFNGGTLRLMDSVDVQENHPCSFLAGGGTIDTGNNTFTALTTGWSGVGTLTKIGSGTMSLSGNETAFSGNVVVKQGTLKLEASQALAGCSAINIGAGATLDVAAIVGGYCLGVSGSQTLSGDGTILGNLKIADNSVHNIGDSPGVQQVQGNYVMNGLLEIEISGTTSGDGNVGYDQVLLGGPGSNDVSIDGDIALTWSGSDWSSAHDRLWIIRNDTNGTLEGAFHGFANGAVIGNYDGHDWRIYYGVDVDPLSGELVPGNDVLLASAVPVPEPSSLGLAVAGLLTAVFVGRRRLLPRKTGWF